MTFKTGEWGDEAKARSKKRLKYFSDYSKNHPRKYSKRCDLYYGKYYRKWREKIIEILGGKCVKCRFSNPIALQIDHINGGGRGDREAKTNSSYLKRVYESIVRGENKYQLLCANCNFIKRYENDEFGKYENGKYDRKSYKRNEVITK